MLVAQPQAVTAGLAADRALAPGKRVGDPAGVGDLADQRAVALPDAQDAPAAAVTDRVGRHLVDGEHEVARARRREARGLRSPRDQPAHAAQ